MVDYKGILRLSSDPKNSKRGIASTLRCSHHTVSDVQTAAKEAGVEWPLDDSVTNEMLKSILFPEKFAATSLYVQPDYPRIHADLALPGVNMTLLWMEYSKRCEAEGTTPYMYTQFCEKYRQWARITKATMHIQHKPGDAMQVDWAGNTLDIYDPLTGEVSKAYLFVAVLPCSCYAYAELCEDMKLENWLLCHCPRLQLLNIPAAGNRHSGKTETANPAQGNRWSGEMETIIPVGGSRLCGAGAEHLRRRR